MGVVIKVMMREGADTMGDPRKHIAWRLMHAHPFMTAAFVRELTASRSVSLSTAMPSAFTMKAKTSGPSVTRCGVALVALQPGQIAYSIIDAKSVGRFMPPVFDGVKADTLPELASKLGLDVDTFMETVNGFNAACKVGTFDHTIQDDCHTEGITPEKTHWARPLDTGPSYGYAVRPGVTFTYFGLTTDEKASVFFERQSQSQYVCSR